MSDILKGPRVRESTFGYEADHLRVMEFERYRELCDATDGFRKVGIQDEDSYRAVIQDERTVFIDHLGCRIPLITPIEYEKMYDEDRCLAESGKSRAMLLAVPLSQLEAMQLEASYEIGEDTIVVVEEFVLTDQPVRPGEHDASRLPFMNAEPFDFINPDLAQHPYNETAWMAAYRFDAVPRDGTPRAYEGQPLASDFLHAWRELCTEEGRSLLPEENSTGTFVLSSEQLAQRPDIIEQLWEISQTGFGKILGAHHPVSMEFNKQFFDKQIAASNTVTGIHCVDGEVVCFGFVALDMNQNEWLNDRSTAIEREIKEAEDAHKPLIHFHELIGRGRRGMGYATSVLSTFFDVTARTGYPYSVFFESTNLSSLYIPPLIIRDLNRSDTMALTSDIDMLGKLSYWALVANGSGAEGSVRDSHSTA